MALVVKNPPANAGDSKRCGFDPWLGRSPEEGMATHSSILAWRAPWTEEPGGLWSIHRVPKSRTQLKRLRMPASQGVSLCLCFSLFLSVCLSLSTHIPSLTHEVYIFKNKQKSERKLKSRAAAYANVAWICSLLMSKLLASS